MAIEIKMPALSPTMEEGTLAKWLVKAGDHVAPGDILAEIETDKATMEFEAVDEGTMGEILVAGGTDGVKVGQLIALLLVEGEAAAPAHAPPPPPPVVPQSEAVPAPAAPLLSVSTPKHDPVDTGDRIKASPLARRLAGERGIALSAIAASGPGGRIVRADVEAAIAPAPVAATPVSPPVAVAAQALEPVPDIPHERVALSSMRRTIARRLTEAKQTIPHIYLTVDARLDALLTLRADLNASLAARGVKLSVNDLVIKALALALVRNPDCNVRFADDALLRFSRADISVAVSIPVGLITPIVTGAESKSVSAIAQEMKSLAQRARDGGLNPSEYQGGTASLSNLGMFGIRQFDAVINPPQAMILAVGAAEQRVVPVEGVPTIATMLTLTGSFDHRAIDGAAAAGLMADLRTLLEDPLQLIA